MKSPFRLFIFCVGLTAILGGGRAWATETVLLSDQFTDNERATQTLPLTAKWLYTGIPSAPSRLYVTPPAGGGELRLTAAGTSGASAMALTYFTASGSPQNLAAGDTITLDFTAKLDALNDASNNLRFMMFNSLGSRPTADSEAGVYPVGPSIYANTHSGYQTVLNTGAATASFNILERNNQGNGIPFSLGTLLGADNQASLNLLVKQVFAVNITIARSANGSSVTISSTVNGVTVTRTDSSAILTAFDGFGAYVDQTALGSGQMFTIDNPVVKYKTAAGVTTTLLSDTFADLDRTNQALPTSSQWFYAGQAVASQRLTAAALPSNQNLVFTPGGSDAMCLAYFKASGSPEALAVGDSITIQANVHLDVLANASDGFRFGLFNSNAVRAAADNEGGIDSASSTYSGYLGYSVWLNPGASGGFNIYRRTAGGTNPFSTTANALMPSNNTAALAISNSPDQIPRFSMTITRLSSGIQIDAAINGRSLVRTETSPTTLSFDTLAFFVSGTALYDGPQAVFDNVNVIHATAPAAPTSVGRIITQSFDGTSWPAAAFVGTNTTGSVALSTYGTINTLGRVVQSGGMKLAVNSAGATGYWAGALNSGQIAVVNTETNLGKLTLAFDLQASLARPVRVRLESADANNVIGGALEKIIYPAAPGGYQRYAFELSDMTPTSGSFSPTAPNLALTFQIEGGVDASSWPASATNSIQLDNVYYASPAYYVKPGGVDTNSGRTEALAYGTIAKALTSANAGDIVLIMSNGNGAVDYSLTAGLGFSRGGVPQGWVTLKNYPGQSPLIQRQEPVANSSYDALTITKGNSTSWDYTTTLSYIEVRGLRLEGTADTLAVVDRGSSTPKSNENGLAINGRYMTKVPHHIRIADNEIFNFSAVGVGSIDIDWFFVENNNIHDTSNWTIYGTSGISSLTPSNFDGTAGNYHHFWLGNRSYHNQTFEPTASTGTITDGNGAIIDTFLTTRHGPYLARIIAANNLFYDNGGSGIHGLKVGGADIVNNTVVRNSQSPALQYGGIFASESNDFNVANNIIVASAGEKINGGSYTTSFPRTTGIQYRNNIYLSDDSTAPYSEPNDSGNLVVTDVKFVNDSSGDFRLRTGSPAFDAALPLGMTPIRDFYGVLRATDGSLDIGACERQPAIVTAPVGQTVTAGANVTFRVAALSGGPNSGLTYQWQRNGVNVSGATSSVLTLNNVSVGQAGSYRCVASVPFDAVTSPAATLTVWSTLQAWRNARYGTIANSGAAADSADPDGNGVPNLVEYALSPTTTFSPGSLPVMGVNGAGALTLTFARQRTDVTYVVEGSTDLVAWQTVSTNPGPIGASVTVTDSASAGSNPRFLRLRITSP